ncbi:hypothetical protein RJ639_044319 [Escallonia herrerae]|uniref:DUF7722 domain-containing protein n=1 Tax=Escallonia herrerae TaxID=1293975 RepID=A0AA88WCP7_9ASTE|nr:hypothetical protein RJ639_044319 [Escallonia herrerae]
METMSMQSIGRPHSYVSGGSGGANGQQAKDGWGGYFQMPLHYPSYTRAEYETMPEWKLDCLLTYMDSRFLESPDTLARYGRLLLLMLKV